MFDSTWRKICDNAEITDTDDRNRTLLARYKTPLSRYLTEPLSKISDGFSYPLLKCTSKRYSALLGTPEHFVQLLLLIEDKRFALHVGVDPIAILRALAFNMCGATRQGASTLTQQLYNIRKKSAKTAGRSVTYKVKQACWAIRTSVLNSRMDLLAEYVNSVYWGRSYYGVDQAAFGYFGVGRSSLDAIQSFFLAERIAMPNSVSPQRISNLLNRAPIRTCLPGGERSVRPVIELYEQVYGGEKW